MVSIYQSRCIFQHFSIAVEIQERYRMNKSGNKSVLNVE